MHPHQGSPHTPPEAPQQAPPFPLDRPFERDLQVVYVDLEGGFFALQDPTHHHRFQPAEPLPQQLCIHGQAVRATLQHSDQMDIFMWGIPVQILDIHPHTPQNP